MSRYDHRQPSASQRDSVSSTTPIFNLTTGFIPLTAGHEYEVYATVTTDTSVDLTLNSSSFSMEVWG